MHWPISELTAGRESLQMRHPVGAFLTQQQEGTWESYSYASRSLTDVE